MKIDWGSITDRPNDYDFTGSDAWVQTAVQSADEGLHPSKIRDAKVHFNIMKVDELVVVTGSLHSSMQLVCSRCAKDFTLPIDTHFKALYSKDASMTGIENNQNDIVSGRSKGWARHAHDHDDEEALEITHVYGEHLDLALVLGEQIHLQIPFQPLCKADCKGICPNCGADWNKGRCACDRLSRQSPFVTALSKLKNDKPNKS